MKRKIKWKNVLLLLFIIICLIELSVSIFNIIKWKLDSKNTNNQITDIQDKVDIKKTVDSDNTEIIEQEEIDLIKKLENEFDCDIDYIDYSITFKCV